MFGSSEQGDWFNEMWNIHKWHPMTFEYIIWTVPWRIVGRLEFAQTNVTHNHGQLIQGSILSGFICMIVNNESSILRILLMQSNMRFRLFTMMP